jgi:DNA-binding beta-propeller fold protein YncE
MTAHRPYLAPIRTVAISIAVALLPADAALALPLAQVADVALPGNPTRLDYQSLDVRKHLLFIAHLGDSAVIAVDTKARRVVGTIPDVRQVHGVLVVPERSAVYASATGTNEVVTIDESTLRVSARTSGGIYPDGMAYAPVTHRLFVSDEHGRTETVIDAESNQRIATIPLGGDVGNTQYDPVSRHIFVNVQTLGQLVEIDPATNAIVGRVPLSGSGCIGNHGLLIDDRNRRAFIACEDSATLLWLDMQTRRIRETWTIGEDPDVLALDPGNHRLFVAAESGVVSIFSSGTRVSRIAQGTLAPAAHTVAIDPQTHLVYFPLENIDGRPVLRIMDERR